MKLMRSDLIRDKAYVNGKWITDDKVFSVVNPATADIIGTVPDLGAQGAYSAIDAAKDALKSWATLKAKDRAYMLHQWYHLILKHTDDLAQIITAEQGKPLSEAKAEILYGASFIEWFAEEGKRTYGDTIPTTIDGARMLTIKQPIGVCSAITPWNFPSAMITRKLAPALAAGCTVICKPSEETPLSALALVALAEESGIPAGVLNIITSTQSKAIGEILCHSPIVSKLSFTGSTAVGKTLMRQSGDTLKKLSLELGGNAPFIVCEDADIDAAVEGAIACKYRNAGQTCVSANRFIVHKDVYQEFTDKLTTRVAALKVANGFEEGADIGPLINQAGLDKVKSHIEDARSKGATLTTGGATHDAGDLFLKPAVLTHVTDVMSCATEEIFGPIAPVFQYDTEEEALSIANATEYGLASYFYSRDIGRIWRMAEALEFGMVAVNAPVLSSEAAPFGGVKESGIGREGSKYGIDEYLEIKYILISGLENKK